jgi:hypothetical protein
VVALLIPDWNQARPGFTEVREMCRHIRLNAAVLPEEPFQKFLSSLRESHSNGGAYLVAFDVGSDPTFDWYASRNRLWDERLLEFLMAHSAIRTALNELAIPENPQFEKGFSMENAFTLEGTLAGILYHGGAYSQAQGDGRSEHHLAMKICDAMFGLRFGEITCNFNADPWTPWFHGIAWDYTAVVFDCRERRLWILAVTDTD